VGEGTAGGLSFPSNPSSMATLILVSILAFDIASCLELFPQSSVCWAWGHLDLVADVLGGGREVWMDAYLGSLDSSFKSV